MKKDNRCISVLSKRNKSDVTASNRARDNEKWKNVVRTTGQLRTALG